ncbi:tRNA1(Val) (adenine(37)-N6)-methyltransferase [Hyphobacterium marinum]|uniref:Methyltransferase domain-containing protein n=1 Tax=Hyphobacterium marinum TaxID=3116574 RepID=A0ABU7M2I0_9PROT|nr:methyltransferase domain-containing protein [Hyphobacterium sp. Y6023]MEE2567480.1 methyltransferase domain-containing protein [Hyphobacterium sp. Y6023]
MATTCDLFLDGQVSVSQPADGFRAGIDAVLLAAALSAKPGSLVLDAGCGAGTAMLCAAHRMTECRFLGLEIDPAMAALARRNIEANVMTSRVEVIGGDVADPPDLPTVNRVFFNPPFFDDPSALRAPKPGKQAAYTSPTANLEAWIRLTRRVLRPKGRVVLIHRADALGDVLALIGKGFGDVAIKPIQPRPGSDAKRVIISAKRGSKSPLRLLPPLALHDDAGGKYSAKAEDILRGRAVIEMG